MVSKETNLISKETNLVPEQTNLVSKETNLVPEEKIHGACALLFYIYLKTIFYVIIITLRYTIEAASHTGTRGTRKTRNILRRKKPY